MRNDKGNNRLPDSLSISFQLDSFKTVIIGDQYLLETEFGKGVTVSIPQQKEIKTADSLLISCFKGQQSSYLSPLSGRKLEEYCRQYVSYKDKNGNKIIWINCFCKNQLSSFSSWKKEIVKVKEKGNCFFNVKINLKKKTSFDLFINRDSEIQKIT